MEWWKYLLILLAILLPFYIFARRQDIKGEVGKCKTCFAVRKQKYYIKNFIFLSDGEAVHFDYLIINHSGVFAVSMHNLKGRLVNFRGRIYLKAFVNGKTYNYFNPVPHDVKKVIKLNAFVPEKVDIIPVIVFPRGNDIKLKAMWLTPVNKLNEVFNEPCDEPLTDSEVEQLYNSLKSISVKNKKVKKQQQMFLKRHCPICGSFIYDRQDGNVFYLKCENCTFRRDFSASIIPERED